MKKLILLVLVSLAVSCSKDKSPSPSSSPSSSGTGNTDCQHDQSKRKGARCKDGTSSNATGQGACSQHGGVDYWICK